MEGEINNFILLWTMVVVSLCYCHTIGKFIPKGTTRLTAIIPIICLFLYLPLNLTSVHLGGPTSFFISWLANFKLLLFAFGGGPLSCYPPISLPRFIPLACLPIKIQEHPCSEITKKGHKSPLNYATKIVLLAIYMRVYDYRDHVHPKVILLLYGLHVYIMLELELAILAAMVRAVVRVELEPQFDDPYLSSSLQDFWGKRWNLMVSSILRPTVYDPVRSFSARVVGKKWATLPAVLATFFVSAIMHELMLYYIGRNKPNWEVMCFFLVHGVCLAVEIVVKRLVNGRFRLHWIVSGPLTLAVVVATVFWLFFPPILQAEIDVRAREETVAFINFFNEYW